MLTSDVKELQQQATAHSTLLDVHSKRLSSLSDTQDEICDKIDEHAEAINKVWKATKKASVPQGEVTLARIRQLKEILSHGPRTYRDLERLLKISPKEMNRLVSKLDKREFISFYREGDGRQKILRYRAPAKEDR